MEKRHVVRLTDDQRAALEERFAGPLTLRQRNRIQVLLRSDRGEPDGEVAEGLGISTGTVFNTRRRFAAEGLDSALTERPRRGVPSKLDGKAEAIIIALACSKAPGGRARWTAKMLASRLVELEVVESVSDDTILRVLKKTRSSRGRSGRGASRRG
jgi:transposase